MGANNHSCLKCDEDVCGLVQKESLFLDFRSNGALQSLSRDSLLHFAHTIGNQNHYLWNTFLNFHRLVSLSMKFDHLYLFISLDKSSKCLSIYLLSNLCFINLATSQVLMFDFLELWYWYLMEGGPFNHLSDIYMDFVLHFK